MATTSLLGYFLTDNPPAGTAPGQQAGGGLALVDVRDVRDSSTVAVDGTCTIVLDPVDPGAYWRITRVIISNDGVGAGPCVLYDGANEGDCRPENALDGTADGLLDVSDVAFYVVSSRSLIARWTGATPGSTCRVRVQYELLARG